MFTNGEIRRAIEKYQKEHPLHFGQMIDVTAIDSKEGADIISQTVEEISKKVAEDTELWCICEMAKMYMRGVKPVYPVRPQGKWINHPIKEFEEWDICTACGTGCRRRIYEDNALTVYNYPFCPNCGADMRGDDHD